MAEYIEREALVVRLKHSPLFLGTNMQFKDGVIDLVKRRPTADVVEVRHGEWNTTETILGRCCECSVCGSCPTMEYRYCPYCGAKMDGKGEGE